MKVNVEINTGEILRAISPEVIAAYYKNHADTDVLLAEIGVAAIMRFLKDESLQHLFSEMAELDIDQEMANFLAKNGYTVAKTGAAS